MKIRKLHPWHVSPRQAVQIQNFLRPRLTFRPLKKEIRYVAGVDVSFSRSSSLAWGVAVVQSYPDLRSMEERHLETRTTFPYIPTLFSFRELPILVKILKTLTLQPDLILCDGQGIAHPRGMGLASHLGLLAEVPTIGCAKKPLTGRFALVGKDKGCYEPIVDRGKIIGAVLRTRTNVKPMFISPGHLCTLTDAIRISLSCTTHFRIPEPIRQAHSLAHRLRGPPKGA